MTVRVRVRVRVRVSESESESASESESDSLSHPEVGSKIDTLKVMGLLPPVSPLPLSGEYGIYKTVTARS